MHSCETYNPFEVHTGDPLIKILTLRTLDRMKTTFFAIVIYFNENVDFTIVYLAKIVFKFFVIF